jgi:hypothetical protein
MKIFSSLFVRVFVAFFVGVFANSAALIIAERALKQPGDNHWQGDARSQQTDAIADAKGADAVARSAR